MNISVSRSELTTGHGQILTEEFINHRIKLSLPKMESDDTSPDAADEPGDNTTV